jgi:hypothetical protein
MSPCLMIIFFTGFRHVSLRQLRSEPLLFMQTRKDPIQTSRHAQQSHHEPQVFIQTCKVSLNETVSLMFRISR